LPSAFCLLLLPFAYIANMMMHYCVLDYFLTMPCEDVNIYIVVVIIIVLSSPANT
jgi:hypothetical protein